jgi:hypothetical protein
VGEGTPDTSNLVTWTGETWTAPNEAGAKVVDNPYNFSDIGGRKTPLRGPTDSTVIYLDSPIKGDTDYEWTVKMKIRAGNYGNNAGGVFVGAITDPATTDDNGVYFMAGYARLNGVQSTDINREGNRGLWTLGNAITLRKSNVGSGNGSEVTQGGADNFPRTAKLIPQELQRPEDRITGVPIAPVPYEYTWKFTWNSSTKRYHVKIYEGDNSTAYTGYQLPGGGTGSNNLNNTLVNANSYYTPAIIVADAKVTITKVSISNTITAW